MPVPHYAKRRDANEREIIDALIENGATVIQADRPCDLIVAYKGRTTLLEVKMPGAGLTPDEAKWWDSEWNDNRAIVFTVASALHACGIE